jgi:hypothetical protein
MQIFKFVSCKGSSLRIWLSLFPMILAVLLLSPSARAQVSFTGASASENFGSQAIGLPSTAGILDFSISSGTKVGSIAVLTTGIANLDFANAPGSTCMAQAYSSTTTCAVDVTFTPQAAGLRMGAVVFFSAANNTGKVLGSVPVYGVGTGPQIAYGPGIVSVLNPMVDWRALLQNPTGVAADAAGDLFITDGQSDPASYRLVIVPAGGGTPSYIDPAVNGQALYLPSCVAVDGAGDLFIGDFGGRVVEVPTGGGAATAIDPVVNGIALSYPSGLAVDGAGDLFIGDYINNRVLEVPAGGGAAIAINPQVNGIPLNDPHGLAVDGTGDLFIADLGNDRVVEVPAGGGAATAIDPTVNGTGLRNPEGVAVDGAGDLFIADNVNRRVVELPAGGGAAFAIDPATSVPSVGEVCAITVDAGGDLFIVQGGLGRGSNIVEEIQHSKMPTLNFPVETYVNSTDSTDGTHTVQLVNIGNQPFAMTGFSYPVDFPEVGGNSNACSGSTSLSPGQGCEVSIEFSPLTSGALSESVTFTDYAQNGNGAQQSMAVSGTAIALAVLISPTPGSTIGGTKLIFTWTAGFGVTHYNLYIGTSGPGSSNLYASGVTMATSATVPSLPARGVTAYARLFSYIGRAWQYTDYTYTESGAPAALTSPTPGTTLSGSTVTFAWSAGYGASGYTLWLGSTAVGSDNLYNSGLTTATSATVTSLPASGVTVYARLFSVIGGVAQYIDYTYTEAGTPATMTSPAPGSTLGTSNVTFTWTPGYGVTQYSLYLGLSGPGSSSLYTSGWVTTTSTTVTSLPAKGATVYARLYSMVEGAVQYIDCTYTESGAPAALSSPTPGSTLSGSGVTFTWSAGYGASGYTLWLGSKGVGSDDLYNSGQQTATSAKVTGLPTNGKTIYARLFTTLNGVQVYVDYTYKAK